jgi:hypothetical protein
MTTSDGLLSCYKCERFCIKCDRYTQQVTEVFLERVCATCEECQHKVETHRIPGTKIGE